MRTDHVNCTLTLTTSTYDVSPFFPDFFPDFLIIFALITILGSAHDHVNSTPTSSPPSLFFSDFITIFHVKMQKFPYLEFFISIPRSEEHTSELQSL